MSTLTSRFPNWLALLMAGFSLSVPAAVKPPEQLLPADTLAVLTVPDFSRAKDAHAKAPMTLLWNDASMKPFREKFMGKLREDLLAPFEQQSGLKLADYLDLVQGQCTLAIVQNGWSGTTEKLPAVLLLVDTRDKAGLLKANLADLKKKWGDAGKTVKTERIRDVDFHVLSFDLAELAKSEGAQGLPKFDVLVGQQESLLLVGTAGNVIEKVLARQAGGSVPGLAEVPTFEADHQALFRDVDSYGWLHFAPLAEILGQLLAQAGESANANPMAPKPDKILGALGLLEVTTLAATGRQTAEGASGDFHLCIPAEKRKGLFKMLAGEAKPSAPLPFVPADVTEFTRWRLDGQKLWATLESLVNEVAPGVMGFVMGQMESALKEKDPDFDFRKNIIGNLGDDIVTYQKAPRGDKPEDLANQPQLTLIGSPKAEALIQGVKALLLIAPPMLSGMELQERDFLGRKIHSMQIAGREGERTLSLCAGGGYLAISTDTGILEDYLRSAEAKVKPLSGMSGLADAAAKVGGMETGLFTFQNDSEATRLALEMFKKHGGLIEEGLSEVLAENAGAGEFLKQLKEWVDVSLLPPWDKLSRFFSFTVMAGKVNNSGFRLGVYTPNPPGLNP